MHFPALRAIMHPYRKEREWRPKARLEKRRLVQGGGAGSWSTLERAAMSRRGAPLTARTRGRFGWSANRGGNAVLPSLCRAVFLFSNIPLPKLDGSILHTKHLQVVAWLVAITFCKMKHKKIVCLPFWWCEFLPSMFEIICHVFLYFGQICAKA